MSIFNGFWVGEINDMCRLSMASYIANNHGYRLWSYDKIKTIPGVEVCDASSIVKRHIYEKWKKLNERHRWQTFANYFRFKLIYEHGGWWADLDSVAVKHHAFDDEYVFASIDSPTRGALKYVVTESKGNIPNGCFKAPKNAKFLADIIDRLNSDGFEEAKCPAFAIWGIVAFTRAIHKHNLLKYKFELPIFTPFPPSIANELFVSRLKIPDWAYSVHFYNFLTKENHALGGVYSELLNRYSIK